MVFDNNYSILQKSIYQFDRWFTYCEAFINNYYIVIYTQL